MRRLVLLDAAIADLLAILEHIARESASLPTARNFVDRLQNQCARLASLAGQLGSGIRSFACNGYAIFFRYDSDTLQVINIPEGHRDIIAHFQADDGQAG